MTDVVVKITGDASDALAEQKRVKQGFETLKNSAINFASQFARAVGSRVKRAFTLLRGWITRVKNGFNALRNIVSSVFNRMSTLIGIVSFSLLLKQIHQVTSAFIAQENALGAVVGTTQKAGEAMDFLAGQSQRLGADISVMVKSYLKFMAAGVESRSTSEELHDLFIALAETGTVLQFTNQELEGSFRALTQMMSKGKVQAEELRGQLGEHLPGAFEIAAKSMGLTTRELDTMLKKGEITAEMLVKNLPKGLREAYGAALPGAIKTARTEFNRLSNDIKIFLEDNKEDIDIVFKKIAQSLRLLFENLQKSGLLDWLVKTNTGFTGMLEFIAEIPQNLEIIFVKAKAFYETSILQLRQFQLEFKKAIGTISESEEILLEPKIQMQSAFGEGNDTFADFLDDLNLENDIEELGQSLGGSFGNFFEQQIKQIDGKVDEQIKSIKAKYDQELKRTGEITGAPQPKFETGSEVPDQGKELKQFEINQQLAFERMIAKLKGFTEVQIVTYEQMMGKVDKLLSDGLITHEQWFEAQELLFADHNLKLLEIQEDYTLKSLAATEERINEEARGWSMSAILAKESMEFQRMTSKEVTKTVLNNFQSMFQALEGESKTAFNINKSLSVAQALIKGYESVISSYAAGARIGGPVLGAAFAATAALATAQMVQQIRAQTFGGGGSISAPSSGQPSTTSPIPEPIQDDPADVPTGITLIVEGNLFANDDFRSAMVDALSVAQANSEINIISG